MRTQIDGCLAISRVVDDHPCVQGIFGDGGSSRLDRRDSTSSHAMLCMMEGEEEEKLMVLAIKMLWI